MSIRTINAVTVDVRMKAMMDLMAIMIWCGEGKRWQMGQRTVYWRVRGERQRVDLATETGVEVTQEDSEREPD